ncbi:C40 family peptidase [Domibacillus epiphyticus]|uniref:Hydrolase Nlp/P60 n=1 Tax=Domibacillus epiphyticus TaxID=1714355 RepID=A0A1V2A6X1_9BACI|nr:C40 family peptidase [Domibacillus epiphyticus]OMP66612.1 hypothetical protein BTO28_11230 [Domibacillus epiphyticus]
MVISWKKAVTALLAAIMLFTLSPLTTFKTEAASVGESIVAYGKKFMGVPYVFGGTTPRGFDCSGFTQYIYRNAADISLPRTAEQQYKVGTSVSKSNLQPGDLIFYANTYKPGISHVGVYAGGNMVLNATSSKGIALVSMNDSYWGPKYAGAKRIVNEPDWFTDLPKSGSTVSAIKTLTDKEIITGYGDYTFRPEVKVTRGQAAAIINRVLGLKPSVMSHFKDVPKSNRFAYDIAAMREANIMNGYEGKLFKPEAEMTRNEMAALIQRAFDLKVSQTAAASVAFDDVNSSHWAYEGIVSIASLDKTGLFKTDRFYGGHKATREQFAVAIYNAMNAK